MTCSIPIHAAWIGNYHRDAPELVHLVKVHHPPDVNHIHASAVVTSYRDLRDVVISVMRMRWRKLETEKELVSFLDGYIDDLAHWEQVACYTLRYERIQLEPKTVVTEMGESLGFRLTEFSGE